MGDGVTTMTRYQLRIELFYMRPNSMDGVATLCDPNENTDVKLRILDSPHGARKMREM